MRRFSILLSLCALSACSAPRIAAEPSLALRVAEAIDPRVPVPDTVPAGTVDPALATRLAGLIGNARAGEAGFDARRAEAARLASAAGPASSETWIQAQQAVGRLVAQYGATTRAAADIDELVSARLQQQKFIAPADRAAIAAAAATVSAISDAQSAAIARLSGQLAH